MSSQVKPVPEGMHTVTAALAVQGAARAIDFYKRAFGAIELARAPDPSGQKIWHAALRIGDSVVFVNDEFPEMGGKAPPTLGGTPVKLWIYVDGVDAAFARAVAAGATVTMPLADMFWGDRMGQVKDPFGYDWAIAQHVKDLTPEQMKQAQDEFVAGMAAQKKT
jgi:uncharacterized glyoxalase superfamily protein PhnB